MDYLTLFDKLGLCNFIYYVWSHLANTKYILSVFKSIKTQNLCSKWLQRGWSSASGRRDCPWCWSAHLYPSIKTFCTYDLVFMFYFHFLVLSIIFKTQELCKFLRRNQYRRFFMTEKCLFLLNICISRFLHRFMFTVGNSVGRQFIWHLKTRLFKVLHRQHKKALRQDLKNKKQIVAEK